MSLVESDIVEPNSLVLLLIAYQLIIKLALSQVCDEAAHVAQISMLSNGR